MRPVDLVLDSRTGNQTDTPIFNLTIPISDVIGLSVFYANIPFSYYIIDETNNQFRLIIAATPYIITMVPGTYNALNLPSMVQDVVNTATSLNFIVFIDNTTSRFILYEPTASFTIEYLNGVDHPFGVDIQTIYTDGTTLRPLKDNAEQSLNVYYHESPRTVNLTGPSQMFLHASLGSEIYGALFNGTNQNDIVAFWPVNNNYQGFITYYHTSPPMIPVTKTTIKEISFYLSLGTRPTYGDGSGNTASHLFLQGESFQFGIRFFVQDFLFQQVSADHEGTRIRTDRPTDQPNLSIRRHRLPHPIQGRQTSKKRK
jgi:hypothetical protein